MANNQFKAKNSGKYKSYLSQFPVTLSDRSWPDNQILSAPIWCSVDLRDGNQALVNPMSVAQKLEMFELLVEVGFKEIEIGFPSASEIEFEFTRRLIDEKRIPDHVIPQVLTQARPHLISRSFEAIEGAKRAIVHVYNSTSELQRRVVFRADKKEIKQIATNGVLQVKELAAKTKTEVILEYTPESFTGTEIDYALEVCNEVIGVWQPTPEQKMILNLPSTVEMSSPNVYADQIEWFCRNINRRESLVISLHTHNDRGTAVAATELGLMAGADRVEGTLFGNGERTGNVDVITLALNMYSQGVDPCLNFFEIAKIRAVAERCTQLPVPARHPYAGDLVFTAFSGSHQDAINKGMRAISEKENTLWEVPYLPIDPRDLGRTYEAIIRINSQSGKGGVAYIMAADFGCDLPKDMHPEFGAVVQKISEKTGAEVQPPEIWNSFKAEYLDRAVPWKFVNFRSAQSFTNPDVVDATLAVEHEGTQRELAGHGNGPIDASKQALIASGCPKFSITNYVQHARSAGSDAESVAYIQIEFEVAPGKHGRRYGVGISRNIEKASIMALISAVNRAFG